MWQEILDILKEKANSGLDVRVLYDDMGSFNRINIITKRIIVYLIVFRYRKSCKFTYIF